MEERSKSIRSRVYKFDSVCAIASIPSLRHSTPPKRHIASSLNFNRPDSAYGTKRIANYRDRATANVKVGGKSARNAQEEERRLQRKECGSHGGREGLKNAKEG